MAQNAQQWLLSPVLSFDTIDSTNNYAMQLIDADKAQPGTTVTALVQTSGKGQRGKSWTDARGESLMMSLIVTPSYPLSSQFIFSAAAATIIAQTIQDFYPDCQVQVKWPNDIIVNAKKAGGILIENVIRGSSWAYSVIGLGLNVLQEGLPPELPHATSLKMAGGKAIALPVLLQALRAALIRQLAVPLPAAVVMEAYNRLLFRRDRQQEIEHNGHRKLVSVREVRADGVLVIMDEDGRKECFRHGEVTWLWA